MTWAWWEVERLGRFRPAADGSTHVAAAHTGRSAMRSPKGLALRALAIAIPSLMTLGCAAAAGAGVAAAALGAAVATSECYGYVDVLVTEGTTGTRQCDATVNARQGDDVVPFRSCFYAPLTKGRWQLSVDKPGYESVQSELYIDPKDNCRRIVHHVSVRLDSVYGPRRSNFGDLAPATGEPPPPPEAPPPPPAQPAPAVAQPPAEPADGSTAAGEPSQPTEAAPVPTTPATPPPSAAPSPPPAPTPAAPPPPKPVEPGAPEQGAPVSPTRSFPAPG